VKEDKGGGYGVHVREDSVLFEDQSGYDGFESEERTRFNQNIQTRKGMRTGAARGK